MSNLLIVLNPDGTIRRVNNAALTTLGYRSDQELIGQRYDAVISADGSPLPLAQQADHRGDMRDTGTYRNISQNYRARDGRLIPVTVSSAVMYDAGGDVQGMVCVAQDVTEQKEAQYQLEYQAGLLNSVFDAIISTEMDLTITSWNKAAERIYGYDAEEVIGRKLTDVVPTQFNRGGSQGGFIREKYLARGYWQNEVTQRRRDGRQLHVLSSISLLRDPEGKPSGTVSINHDITKRIQAEEALQKRANQLALLRQADIEISSTLDIDRVLEMALVVASNISGADAGMIVLIDDEQNATVAHVIGRYEGHLTKDQPHPLDSGIIGRVLQARRAQKIDHLGDEPERVSELADSVQVMAFPLISHDRWLGVINVETAMTGQFTPETFDLLSILTSRIAAAIDNARLYGILQTQLNELQTLYGQVSKLEQLKTDMIRLASHDLRNPIGIINGYVQLLRVDLQDVAEAEHLEFIQQIGVASERMDEIATNILSLERIHQIAQAGYDAEVDLYQVAVDAVNTQMASARDKSLNLQIQADTPHEAYIVKGDESQLHEALINYLTNAIKYTPEGGEIVVCLRVVGDHAQLTVRDNGYGIPADQQDKVFSPFFRAKSAATNGIDGVGLGLHLVNNIIARHRGRVIFSSEYGAGSTFGFSLPLVDTSRL